MENNTLNRVSDIQKVDQKVRMLTLLGNRVQGLQQTLAEQQQQAYIDPQVVLEFITTNQETELTQTEINMATVDIDYLEGFPVVNGLPFWERLDCEPLDYYKLFKLYRNQKLTDFTRSFEKLIDQLNTQSNLTTGLLNALSKIYHWQIRTKSFDDYNSFLIEKERDKDIKSLEGKHRTAADKIFNICVNYLDELAKPQDNNKPSKLQMLKPSELKDWLDLAVKLERISLGLPGDKPTIMTKEEQNNLKTIINIDQSKNVNLNSQNKERDKNKQTVSYLQEIVDVLTNANALPKELVAQGDMQEEIITIVSNDEEEEKNE